MNKWVKLSELNVSESKWPKFRKLRLPARVAYNLNSNPIVYKEGLYRLGIQYEGSVNVVPVDHPNAWFTVATYIVEVFITDNDLVKLGCIILSE